MPSKRSHGEGTLRHRSDGRWELRMMDGYQKDGSPRFKTFYGKTQKEVKLKLKEYQDALISGIQLDTILYFEDWADTWFEGHRDNIAPTTQESYKYCLKMLKEGFYHRPLTVIRPIDIENFLKGMWAMSACSHPTAAATPMYRRCRRWAWTSRPSRAS